MPVETVPFHIDTAEFKTDVVTVGQGRYFVPPMPEHIIQFAGIGSNTYRARKVIEDDINVRIVPSKLNKIRDLGVVTPSVKAEIHVSKNEESSLKIVLQKLMFDRIGVRILDQIAAMPASGIPDTFETIR